MARVLMAWELGANLGHIDRLLVLAEALKARGHEVIFVLRDLSRAHARVAAAGYTVGQAPVWLPRMANPPRLSNYTLVLANAGWLDSGGLTGLLCGWRTWFELLRPQVLVCDHAPTALLATRCTGLPMQVWACGSSFEIPPTATGFFPAFMPGAEHDAAASCAAHDALLLPSANTALAALQAPALARLTDVFSAARRVLTSLPELAHYDGYGAEVQWVGPSYAGDSGVTPIWPDAPGRRAFVYLEPTHPAFSAVIGALQAHGLCALVHSKGLSPSAATRLAGPGLRFSEQPLRMHDVLASADMVISHGGQGTLCAAALAGKPQLLLPQHMEQAMAARRVAAAGLGLVLGPSAAGQAPPDCTPLLRKLIDDPAFTHTAGAFAHRHRGHNPHQTAERTAALIDASLAPHGQP